MLSTVMGIEKPYVNETDKNPTFLQFIFNNINLLISLLQSSISVYWTQNLLYKVVDTHV